MKIDIASPLKAKFHAESPDFLQLLSVIRHRYLSLGVEKSSAWRTRAESRERCQQCALGACTWRFPFPNCWPAVLLTPLLPHSRTRPENPSCDTNRPTPADVASAAVLCCTATCTLLGALVAQHVTGPLVPLVGALGWCSHPPRRGERGFKAHLTIFPSQTSTGCAKVHYPRKTTVPTDCTANQRLCALPATVQRHKKVPFGGEPANLPACRGHSCRRTCSTQLWTGSFPIPRGGCGRPQCDLCSDRVTHSARDAWGEWMTSCSSCRSALSSDAHAAAKKPVFTQNSQCPRFQSGTRLVPYPRTVDLMCGDGRSTNRTVHYEGQDAASDLELIEGSDPSPSIGSMPPGGRGSLSCKEH